jgi:hypothetical protein
MLRRGNKPYDGRLYACQLPSCASTCRVGPSTLALREAAAGQFCVYLVEMQYMDTSNPALMSYDSRRDVLRRSAVLISIASRPPSFIAALRPVIATYLCMRRIHAGDYGLNKVAVTVTCFCTNDSSKLEHATSDAPECAHDPLTRNTHAQLLCVI